MRSTVLALLLSWACCCTALPVPQPPCAHATPTNDVIPGLHHPIHSPDDVIDARSPFQRLNDAANVTHGHAYVADDVIGGCNHHHPDPWVSNSSSDYAMLGPRVGGSNGTDQGVFEDFQGGGVLQEITVWAATIDFGNMYCLVKIAVKFTSGAVFAAGTEINNPTVASFEFQEGERIAELSMWDNGEQNNLGRLAAIQFLTDRGRKFEQGVPCARRGEERRFTGAALGGGLVIGLHPHAGLAIDSLSLLYLRPIKAVKVVVGSYPGLGQGAQDGSPIKRASASLHNTYDRAQMLNLTGVTTVETSHRWVSSMLTERFGVDQFSVVAPLPLVDEGQSGVSWNTGEVRCFPSNEAVTERMVTVLFYALLDPGERWEGVATTMMYGGGQAMPFAGEASLMTENEAVWKFGVSGNYTGLAFTGPDVTGRKVPPPGRAVD